MSRTKAILLNALGGLGQRLPGGLLAGITARLSAHSRTSTYAYRLLDHPAAIHITRGAAIEANWQAGVADPYDEQVLFKLRTPRLAAQAATPERIAELRRIVAQHPDARAAALCLSSWLARRGQIGEATEINRALARADAATDQAAGELPEEESLAPSFLIFGMPKSGTTSLFRYLCRHPQIEAPIIKEIRYWSNYYEYGWPWYLSHFPPRIGHSGAISGEATPHYIYDEKVPERLSARLPRMKLILLIRNPADRAYSHYQMQVRSGDRHQPWAQVVEREIARIPHCPDDLQTARRHQHSLLAKSVALPFLRRWREYFPQEQLFVVRSEALFAEAEKAVNSVHSFLGLAPYPGQAYANVNPGAYDPMDAGVRRELDAYFAPYRRELEAYLQMPLDWGRRPGA